MHTIIHIIKAPKVFNTGTGDIGSHDVSSQAADWSRSYVMTSCQAADWSRSCVGYLGCFNDLSDLRICGPVVSRSHNELQQFVTELHLLLCTMPQFHGMKKNLGMCLWSM